ncbi:MAG: FAD-dependent oxidoreductase [Eubacteriales bacterium]|nr:FAD-dependent oxidoreductase [Eubacteriales bacterium]
MADTTQTLKQKTLSDSYDAVIAGGGLAGVMAAVAAAREGMKVLLVEKHGFLGGMATAGLVNPFMNFYERGGHGVLANSGLFLSLLERMYALGGTTAPRASSYMEEFMKLALDRLCAEYHVKLLFHAKVSDAELNKGEIKSITVSTCSGNIKLTAPVFADATGDADLSAFAGLEYKLGRDEDGLCQPMTLCFRLGNVDWTRYDRKKANALYNEMQSKGIIKNPRENILVFRMPVDNIMHLNTTRIVGRNPVDAEDLSAAEIEGREQVYEMYKFMKENIEGLEDCCLIMSAPETGIRESRRIVGRYEITREDLIGTRKFDDRIARGTYDIDIHNPSGSGTVIESIPNDDYYTIPYRALLPQKADNLIVAGRPISSTHAAHSSFRVMPITSCIGEAAGVAAALAVKHDCAFPDIPVDEMQSILTDRGALI